MIPTRRLCPQCVGFLIAHFPFSFGAHKHNESTRTSNTIHTSHETRGVRFSRRNDVDIHRCAVLETVSFVSAVKLNPA